MRTIRVIPTNDWLSNAQKQSYLILRRPLLPSVWLLIVSVDFSPWRASRTRLYADDSMRKCRKLLYIIIMP
jgi:hypothetical protein